MQILSGHALRLLRHWTGVRLRHVFAAALFATAALAALALPFWWLGAQADSVAGVLGVAFVAILYAWSATLLLVLLAFAVGRHVLLRMRRSIRLPRRAF